MEKIAMRTMGLWESFVFFAVPTLLLYVATHIAVPALSQVSNLPMVVSWFICGGTLVFLPLFVAAFVFYRIEGNSWQIAAIVTRFRLSRLSWHTLRWTVLGIVGIGILTYGIVAVGQAIVPGFSAQPSFMSVPPLTSNNQ